MVGEIEFNFHTKPIDISLLIQTTQRFETKPVHRCRTSGTRQQLAAAPGNFHRDQALINHHCDQAVPHHGDDGYTVLDLVKLIIDQIDKNAQHHHSKT